MVSINRQMTLNEGVSLSIRDVRKQFDSQDHGVTPGALAIETVTLTIAPGELVCILGPSGCGKSTLLRIIAGLTPPTSGEVLVGDERISEPSAERGLVFQDPSLFPWLTVRRNIESGLLARGVLRQMRTEVDAFMRLVGLESFANSFPHHL